MTMTTQQRDTDAVPVSRIAKWAPLAVILTGTFVYILDFFVVNVALPDIQRSLHASAAAIEWLVSGYALTSAVPPGVRAGAWATTTVAAGASASDWPPSCSPRRCAPSPPIPAS